MSLDRIWPQGEMSLDRIWPQGEMSPDRMLPQGHKPSSGGRRQVPRAWCVRVYPVAKLANVLSLDVDMVFRERALSGFFLRVTLTAGGVHGIPAFDLLGACGGCNVLPSAD